MADIDLKDLFGVESTEEALTVVYELEEELIKLGKRIRKRIKNLHITVFDVLWDQVKNLGSMLEDAFRVESLDDYTQAAAIYGEELAGALYQTQASFGALQIAVIRAAAPIVQVLLPVVQAAISALTGLANSIGQVLRMLFLGSAEAGDFSSELEGVVSTGTRLKKTLAGFDQINRLNERTGSYGGSISIAPIEPLSGSWEKFAGKLAELFEPLKKIDLTPAAESLERLKKALEPITKALFEGLEWAWYNILVPLAEWAAEELLPVFLDTLAAALEALGRIIEELKPVFLWLWENYLKPLAQWKGDQLIAYLQGITEELTGVSGWIGANQNPIDSIIQSGKLMMETIAGVAEKTMGLSGITQWATESFEYWLKTATLSRGQLAGTNSAIDVLVSLIGEVATAFGIVEESSNTAWESITGVWENAWGTLKEKLTDPAAEGMKDMANGMIGMVNSMLQGVSGGVNAMSKALNKFSFSLPDWVPIIGGKGIHFSIPNFIAPVIPFLAKGAVLPANKPFMAVVGDQKHGTNIEAPLSTIQEAVALVMEDYMGANMAGHEATVQVLRELLAAVLGIRIGDEAIAAAVQRYDRKMAVVRGGYL